jgi:putative nucleotidyltransferase with HDIG domain
VLLTALAHHDGATYVHSLRVGPIAWWLASLQGWIGPAREHVFLAGLLHDVGKIYLPRSVLQRHVHASAQSAMLQTHAMYGARLLRQYPDVASLAPIIGAQHERPDGRGTPHGLNASAIPTASSMIAVADALDQLNHPPGGEPPAPVDVIYDTLISGAGSRWDARIATSAADAMARQAPAALGPTPREEACDYVLVV